MNAFIFIVIELVVFHSVDGHEVAINPKQVSSITAARPDVGNEVLVETVKCVIGMTNGKFHSVAETCDEVKRKLEAAK